MTTPWEVVELAFESALDHARPFLDVAVEATFTGPDGQHIIRPAFWDGGRTWRVRFAPTAAGTWRWTLTADVVDAGLHGPTGELTCEGTGGHGFLRAAEHGRRLEHADGTPFLWLGDTHWRFTSERWDESNKPGWSSQFRDTVDRRVQQGYSIYQANLMMFDWGATSSPYWLPDALFETPDVEHLRTVVDPRMRYLAERGLVVALGLGWHQLIDAGVEGVRRFARLIVARYGAQPMVWTLGGENAGYEPDLVRSRLDGWRSVAEAILAADDYHHPITQHSANDRPIAPAYQDEGWLTLTLNQHGHGDLDLDPRHYLDFRAAHPGMPLVEGESLYEGLTSVEPVARRTVTATMVRHAAYRAFQSGCCGYSYGAQGCWNGAWDARESATSWGTLPWSDGVDLPGGAQLGHLRRFYDEVGWSDLEPSDCFTAGGAINARFNPAHVTANADRSVVVTFFPETFRTDEPAGTLNGLPPGPAHIRWFDPRAGVFGTEDDISIDDGVLVVPTKPDDQDWLLVIRSTRPEGASA